ncbi:MAG: hypothetical protein K2H55_00710 [Helicobacter sp.]|nr:hypothetical protein [Helicobacter sp.]
MAEKYRYERMRSDWERDKIKKASQPKEAEEKPLMPLTQPLCAFLKDPIDQECCEFLAPEFDIGYKGGTEMAVILHTDDEMIAIEDIVRFIHAIIVGKYFQGGKLINKPLSILIKSKRKTRIFEVISANPEVGKIRQGVSILRSEGYLSKPGVVDILIQPLTQNARGINADNLAYQLSILSNGKPHTLTIAEELITDPIFVSVHDEEEEASGFRIPFRAILFTIIILVFVWFIYQILE